MVRAIGTRFDELKRSGKKAFIPFITAGDPDLETTIRLVPELESAGAHVVELGIPFSDPVADGPTIQRSSERALRHHYRLADYLDAVRTIRGATGVPLILFSYFNPILQYGLESLARDARRAGIDGILVTDMTPEEADEYCACMEEHQIDPIFLAAPTSSSERLARIAERCRGFVYLVSRTGVTGVRQTLSETVVPTLNRMRQHTSLPIVVGFGISTPKQVRAVWEVADGAVVGSAIVEQIERFSGSSNLPARVREYCVWLIEGRDG